MFGNTNIIQIMLLMRHVLNIATQLPVTTTTIDDTTEFQSVYGSVAITIFRDHTHTFVLSLLLTSSFPASFENENSNKLCYKRTKSKGLSYKITLTVKLTATFLITLLIILLRFGDIETNPGPILSQT